MFYRDHAPPHFHATYGEFDIEVSIENGVVTGKFPKRAMRHWSGMIFTSRTFLEDGQLAAQRKPLKRSPPLE